MNALEAKVLELIGEDTDAPDVFTDDDVGMAPIRDSLNDALQEIIMLTGGYKRQHFLPMRQSQAFYRLRPKNGEVGWLTDVWSVNRQRRLEQTDLFRVMHHDPRWMKSNGDPYAYMPLGQDVVGFYPKPSGNADVMELTLVEIPFAYTSDRDRIKLRQSFQYAMVNYAVAEFWASRGDAGEAQKNMQLYLDAMGIAEEFMQRRDARELSTSKDPWPQVTA